MPSTITHAYIGIETMKKLNYLPREIIKKNLNNYKVYCQNMDVLYFYRIFLLKENMVQKLGHRFHTENVFNYFKMLIEDNKENKDEELFTFIAGLITHYQADSIMHPYINYLSHNKNKTKEVDKHFEIETYLDNYFINKYQTPKYQTFNGGKFIFNYTKKEIIEKEIDKVFDKYFNYKGMGSIYYKALNEMAFVFKHIRYDKIGIKKKIYQLIDINPFNIRRTTFLSYHFTLNNDDYYLNTNHNIWFNYKNKKLTSNMSFIDLMDDVTNKSSYIINELYFFIFNNKKVNLEKLIENNSYSTGLPLA